MDQEPIWLWTNLFMKEPTKQPTLFQNFGTNLVVEESGRGPYTASESNL